MKTLTTRILIVDDHPVVREGLRCLVERHGNGKVVGEADTAAEAIRLATTLRPEIVILDDSLPDLSSAEACRRIVSAVEGCRVILFASHPSRQDLYAAMAAGASAYALKQLSCTRRFTDILSRVRRGENLLAPDSLAAQLDEINHVTRDYPRNAFADLSWRERLILSSIAEGLTNKEIADRLNVSTGAARNYVARLFAKLNVSNRAAAASLAAQHRLFTYPPYPPAGGTGGRAS